MEATEINTINQTAQITTPESKFFDCRLKFEKLGNGYKLVIIDNARGSDLVHYAHITDDQYAQAQELIKIQGYTYCEFPIREKFLLNLAKIGVYVISIDRHSCESVEEA